MANYQELLSKAVGALQENNGASRREVYEKARKALVTQLRAINPPLPAREITQHRLELEDCIREVEHDATEALLGALRETEEVSIKTVEEDVADFSAKETSAPVSEKVKTEEAQGEDSADKDPVDKDSVDKDLVAEDKKAPESAKEKITKPAKEVAEKSKSKGAQDKDASGTKPNSDKDVDALDAIIAQAENDLEIDAGGDVAKEVEATAESVKTDIGDALPDPAGEPVKVEPIKSILGQSRPSALASTLTIESDKGVGAAMSRVREVENDVKEGAASFKQSAGDVSSGVAGKLGDAGTAGIAGAGAVLGSATKGAGAALKGAGELAKDGGEVVGSSAQSAVDRAIQTLDREALGKEGSQTADNGASTKGNNSLAADEIVSQVDEEEKGGSGLTIFLVLVVLLLGAVGGGGYWAWKEGFIDLDSLFASGEIVEEVQTTDQTEDNSTPIRQVGTGDETSGPGNTTTDVETDEPADPDVALEDPNKTDERLTEGDGSAQTDANAESDTGSQEPGAQTDEGDKTEDRLGADGGNDDPSLVQEGDPEATSNNVAAQSLLLEASPEGGSGAVPFSGTVAWSRGLDELGEPTLIGEANIPARNMNVKVLIRRNADPSLPASHLMEIDFDLSETFAGGAVAGLPGILLKNEELVQGAALVGASARVVGNSFLFALSAADQDVSTNLDLLENRKWMDLALIYSSGRRAIITLEKDAAAQELFSDVMAKWRDVAGGSNPADVVEGATDAVEGAVEGAVQSATDAVTEGANSVVEGATDLVQDAVTPDSNG